MAKDIPTLIDIGGIGSAKIRILREHGIETLEQLVDMSPEALREIFPSVRDDIASWQNQARDFLAQAEQPAPGTAILHIFVTAEGNPIVEARILLMYGHEVLDAGSTEARGSVSFDVSNWVNEFLTVSCYLPSDYSFGDVSWQQKDLAIEEGRTVVRFFATDRTIIAKPPLSAEDLEDAVKMIADQLDTEAEQQKANWKKFNKQLKNYTVPTTRALNDIAVSYAGDGYGGYTGNGNLDGSSAEKKVDKAIAQVLGRPIPLGRSDTTTLRAVLNGTFPENPETGRILRQPVRTYVASIGESGYLAADQGTLSREVRVIASEAQTELASLRSIIPDTDDELAMALTELIRSDLDALTSEAGRIDRPRYHRVEEIGQSLVTQIAELSAVLGLDGADNRGNPNLVTPEEAQLLAGVKLLQRYTQTLGQAYETYFESNAGKNPLNGSFSGWLAVSDLLLAGLAQTVYDVRATLASAGLSQAESQTTYIAYDKRQISIDGILSWIESVATTEGPEMIALGGRPGLNRVLNVVANQLQPLVGELLSVAESNEPPHPALARLAVLEGLTELYGQLEQFDVREMVDNEQAII